MTPPPVVLLAVVALVAVAAFTLGMWVERSRWRRAIVWYRDLHEPELARVEAERDQAQQRVRYLIRQVEVALRIIADLSDARIADAAQLSHAVVPPQVWRALMEAREQPGVN